MMQCIVMHQAYDGFYFILKEHLKLNQKIDFLVHFERFLVYAFLHPMSYTLIFCQIKRLLEVHNCDDDDDDDELFLWYGLPTKGV